MLSMKSAVFYLSSQRTAFNQTVGIPQEYTLNYARFMVSYAIQF